MVVQHIKYEIHRFARHQYAWFRTRDERIHWFDVRNETDKPIQDLMQEFLGDREKVKL